MPSNIMGEEVFLHELIGASRKRDGQGDVDEDRDKEV